MCIYGYICPAYEKKSDMCNKHMQYGCAHCVPFLLEAYHGEKGTDLIKLCSYLHLKDDVKNFTMITVLDVFKSCDKEYQQLIYKELGKILKEDD